ncbi:MAG: cyclic peptide export ABC transporter [Psychrosphaera sp.]|nr:cyclic peptide export ABC transporter [Psychrosphaera sp.]
MKQTNKLTLKGLLLSSSRKTLIFAIVLSMISGMLYALIIPTILAGLNQGHDFILGKQYEKNIQAIFFGLISFVFVCKATSVVLVNNLAKTAVAKLRVDLSNKINAMEVSQVEKIGLPRLLNVLTEDMNRVTGASLAIPMVLVSSVTAIGMLVYLAILDFQIFLFTVLAIVVGLFLFQVPVNRTKVYYNKARDLRDVMQEGFRGLIFGSYELKLDRTKSKRFIKNELESPIEESLQAEKRGDLILHIAGNSSEILCFFAIGMVVFLLPRGEGFNEQNLYGVIMALLYITGPIAAILSLMQNLKMGEIALARINQIYTVDVVEQQSSKQINKDWQKLTLKDIKYAYSSEDFSFSIGKINLSLERGQTYFIVGGNGSGKSTLSKVISMHYLADEGTMSFDGQVVNDENRESARSRLFVIYSNYYLFHTIYNDINEETVALIDKYLKLFKLEGKTELIGNDFTTVDLSDGQRRRLALIVALAEDRDIYILDEWAADQDPQFKEMFYDFVLPDLKKKGKTIIAITPDARYFAYCDEVVKMENGKIVDTLRPTKHVKNEAAIE